ncbi:MAG: serpin family protein [Nitrosopumilus sp.]|nr:serpin family protein [Nitrosopumilus sp.]
MKYFAIFFILIGLIVPQVFASEELSSSQNYEFKTLQGASCIHDSTICYGTFSNGTTIPVQCDYPHSCGVIPFDRHDLLPLSPAKQFQSGISTDEIQCKESLILVTKNNGSPACVTPESAIVLYERGWTLTLHIAVNRGAPSVYLGPTDIPSANNQFALNFYSHVIQDKESNVFFSPTSIFTAFAIAYEGAKDNTASEMKDVFGFESDESKRRIGFADMQRQLNMKQQNNIVSLANALWVAENFEVLPEYADTAKTYYGSEVESVSFTSKEKGVDLINSWIDEKTHGKIKKIFEKLDPSTKLVITNAIYFKGIWEDPFDKTKTVVGDFHVTSDNTIQMPMMESKTTFPNITVNDLVQIVELPYEGENFSMLILLPRDVNGMKSLEESLSVDNLNKWKGELQKKKTKVYMPKFKLETEYDLKSVLQEMGIHDAFSNADFTGISNSGLYIEKAVHKAFVEVNEEGTEAAAATGIAMFQSGPFEFMVDRPFIFIIQDNETRSILFIGKVVNPLQ